MNAVCVFDFTINDTTTWNVDNIKEKLKEIAKEWNFQLERGVETEHLHYQGRLSLKVKKRLSTLLNEYNFGWHWSITSKENCDNNFYVTKSDTREAGPWTSNDIEKYIPKQYKINKLFPAQEYIGSYRFNMRSIINVLICKPGNWGKSTVAHVTRLTKNGVVLPPVNEAKELVQSCCDILMAKNLREEIIIFIDLPRAICKERLYGLYTAIEQIGSGYVYDLRNKYKEWDFDTPTIWVFSNSEPDQTLLSRDRWELWDSEDDGEYKYIRNRKSGLRI